MRVRIKLANPATRAETVEVSDALVDTGATLTTVPRALADRLKLDVVEKHTTRSAAGPVEVEESYAYFEYDGRRTVTPVWINDAYPGVLIGVVTLESLGLQVDPGSGKLTNSEFLLL